ncbi:MAG: hypothetical protein M3246_06865 [Actinomycetota bacterium]|nr:hypothetical protein [Actinomycetota bacterium]
MRPTYVGIKCPDDAELPRSARTGVMQPNQVLKSFLAGIGVALVGIPVVYVLFGLPLQWLLSAAAGYGAGTFINRAGGRNGGPLAIAISVVSTAVPFLVWLMPSILAGSVGFQVVPMVLAAVAAGLANRRF